MFSRPLLCDPIKGILSSHHGKRFGVFDCFRRINSIISSAAMIFREKMRAFAEAAIDACCCAGCYSRDRFAFLFFSCSFCALEPPPPFALCRRPPSWQRPRGVRTTGEQSSRQRATVATVQTNNSPCGPATAAASAAPALLRRRAGRRCLSRSRLPSLPPPRAWSPSLRCAPASPRPTRTVRTW